MSSPTPPEAPDIPELPPLNKLRTFAIGLALWVGRAVIVAAAPTIYLDIHRNEFTDWQKMWWVLLPVAGDSAIKYWEKYRAWLAAPPGTELVKTTKTETAIATTPDSVVTIKKETVDVQPKEETKL
jgi:hypothetical protein